MKAKILLAVLALPLLTSCMDDAEVCRTNLDEKCTVAAFLETEKTNEGHNTFALPEYGSKELFDDGAGSLGALLDDGLLKEGDVDRNPDLGGWVFYFRVDSSSEGSSFGVYFLSGLLEGYLKFADWDHLWDSCEVDRKVLLDEGRAQSIVALAGEMAQASKQSSSSESAVFSLS
jgi:hypothetical protein